RPVGDRCPPDGSSALLAVRLGARYRRQELFRQHRLGAAAQGGPQTYGLPVGASLHRALAEGSVQMEDGSIVPRAAGTPQGGVVIVRSTDASVADTHCDGRRGCGAAVISAFQSCVRPVRND